MTSIFWDNEQAKASHIEEKMFMEFYKYPDVHVKVLFVSLLSQPNNNHNPTNKTTITVVGLGQSNRWEPPPPHTTNSKLHDRAEIEQNSENKSY